MGGGAPSASPGSEGRDLRAYARACGACRAGGLRRRDGRGRAARARRVPRRTPAAHVATGVDMGVAARPSSGGGAPLRPAGTRLAVRTSRDRSRGHRRAAGACRERGGRRVRRGDRGQGRGDRAARSAPDDVRAARGVRVGGHRRRRRVGDRHAVGRAVALRGRSVPALGAGRRPVRRHRAGFAGLPGSAAAAARHRCTPVSAARPAAHPAPARRRGEQPRARNDAAPHTVPRRGLEAACGFATRCGFAARRVRRPGIRRREQRPGCRRGRRRGRHPIRRRRPRPCPRRARPAPGVGSRRHRPARGRASRR